MFVLKKFWLSLKYACQGLITAWQTQLNFRWHTLALTAVVILGFIVRLENLEWAAVLLISCLVLAMELINTIIERLVDLAKPRVHVYAKMIKDVMAGATLLMAIFAIVIGLLIFLPHFR